MGPEFFEYGNTDNRARMKIRSRELVEKVGSGGPNPIDPVSPVRNYCLFSATSKVSNADLEL